MPTEEYLGWMAEYRPVTTKYMTSQNTLSAIAASDLLPELTLNESYWKKTADSWRIGTLNVKVSKMGLERMLYARNQSAPELLEKELKAINEELQQYGDTGAFCRTLLSNCRNTA